MDPDYRPCVLAVFTNAAGQVLVGERAVPPGAWQFPQGGIDPGETPEAAVHREMREELGCVALEILGRSATPIRYAFPPGLAAPLAKTFKGQDQIWFLVRFAAGGGPDLGRATDKEFLALAWVEPAEALRRVVPFKYDAYRLGYASLGLAPGPGGC